MNIIAIDPGHTHSAYVLYSLPLQKPYRFAKVANESLLIDVRENSFDADHLVIEQVACMGMTVGAEVFETVFWSGRFCEGFTGHWSRVKRHEVKTHLCGNQRAKDPNIRQALIDRYGPGKELAIGTKKAPGPLYGLSGDCWAALSVAVTWADKNLAAKPLELCG